MIYIINYIIIYNTVRQKNVKRKRGIYMTDYEKVKALFQEIGIKCEFHDELYKIEILDNINPNHYYLENYYLEIEFDFNGKFKRIYIL